MKIFYLSTSTLPSKEANSIHVMKMCHALADNNHKVTLLGKKGDMSDNTNIYRMYGVKDNFNIELVEPNSYIRRLRELVVAFKFRRLVIKEKPDIIYGRNLWALLLLINNRSPMIYESHALSNSKIRIIAENILFKSRNLKRLVVISDALKTDYKAKRKVESLEIITAHDGADIPAVRNENLSKLYKPNIGYIGHLYPGRGIDIILSLAKVFSQCQFHIVGGNDDDIQYWKKESLDLKNITFHGFVPNGELYKIYSYIDIMLSPYQRKVRVAGSSGDTSKWMSPLKIFEYMSFSKAIISSDIPVLKEVLKDGYNSVLCDPENINEWIDALEKVIKDDDFRLSIAQNAYRDFVENYTWFKRAIYVINGKSGNYK